MKMNQAGLFLNEQLTKQLGGRRLTSPIKDGLRKNAGGLQAMHGNPILIIPT
jgi:hypothetical protein